MKKNAIILFLFFLIISRTFAQPLGLGYDKFLGCTEGSSPISPVWGSYWNQISPENAGKWGSVEGSRDVYSWGGLDNAYNFAKQRGIPIKWHCFVWGNQQPGWITTLPAQEQADEVEEWIRLVSERYPDLDMIDVVNEPLPGHAPAPYRLALGGAGTTGWDWVVWAFQKARQYFPHAKLILNEYNILNSNDNTNQLLKIVKILQDRGLIDGIGIQAHRFELENSPVSYMKTNQDRLGNTGLAVYLTEFDLGNINDSGTPNDATQLQLYQRIFPMVFEHPAVKGITFWGYRQGQMWQTTAYLLNSDGTERPAMKWLREYLTMNGSFRSYQSGNWNDVNSWESYNGNEWTHPSSNVPSSDQAMIIIQKGHTITMTQAVSVDQLYVNSGATLIVNPGTNLQINDQFIDMTVQGTLRNLGTITKADSAEIIFEPGSIYSHEQNGGSVPDISWKKGSTIQFSGISGSIPGNLNQNFSSILWNCPAQNSDFSFGWNGNIISGDINIQNTGTGSLYLCSPAEGENVSVAIQGDIIQSGGNFSATGTSNGNNSVSILHDGNITITGGNFSISRGSQGGTGTTVWNLTGGNFSMSNAVTQNSNPGGAKFVFSKQGTQSLTLGTGNTVTSFPVEVSAGATLNMGPTILEGSGIFTLDAGATLETSHPDGVNGNLKNSGLITLSDAAGYTFSGQTSQVTGNLMPEVVNNLTVNAASTLTLSKSVTVNGTLDIKTTGLTPGSNQIIFGPNSTLSYSGNSAQVTSDVEFPAAGPKNVSIMNIRGVTLHAPRAINGGLLIGGKFYLGDNDFTADSASNTGTTRFIVTDGLGVLRLRNVGASEMYFPIGSSSLASLWITNSGEADDISVRVELDNSTAALGGRVKAKWTITEGTPGGGNYNLKFGWSSTLEDNTFRLDREGNAFIFNLTDTVEAGSGPYIRQLDEQPRTVSRGGITTLGPFSVGKFGAVTDVKEQTVTIPGQYSLSQNYPNPFNPSTNIRFSIPKQSNIKIIIYNILGNKVKTLVNTFKTAGEYNIIWDATDDNNTSVSSGIYFYSLEAENTKIQKKMILIK